MKNRANLIYIYVDQMRGSAMGFLGKEPVITPNIDKFASESVVLTDAASNYPVCVPHRTILMSGKYSHSNGVITNCFSDGLEMDNNLVWWTDVLSGNSFDVAYYGKWHISKHIEEYQGEKLEGPSCGWLPPARRHGISHFKIHTGNNHMNNNYVSSEKGPQDVELRDQWTVEHETDLAIDYIKNSDGKLRDSSKPFSLILSFNPPHAPYGPVPEKYKAIYQNPVEEYCENIENLSPAGTKFGDTYRKNIRDYYAAISGIDDNLGRLFTFLEESGNADNTIIVFTADHGDNLGRHDCWDPKNTPYEEAMQVPFIIRWPAKIKPRQDDLLLSSADIYPTLLTMLGVGDKLPKGLEGTDLSETILTGNGPRPTSQLYLHIPTFDHRYGRRGVRTHRYTFMLDRGWHTKDAPKDLSIVLYDRKNDPYQTRNVADENPELVKELIVNELIPWLKHTKDPWLEDRTNFPNDTDIQKLI